MLGFAELGSFVCRQFVLVSAEGLNGLLAVL